MMSLWDALRMNMMISYQELVRTFLSAFKKVHAPVGLVSGVDKSNHWISSQLIQNTGGFNVYQAAEANKLDDIQPPFTAFNLSNK